MCQRKLARAYGERFDVQFSKVYLSSPAMPQRGKAVHVVIIYRREESKGRTYHKSVDVTVDQRVFRKMEKTLVTGSLMVSEILISLSFIV